MIYIGDLICEEGKWRRRRRWGARKKPDAGGALLVACAENQ
jgi:hypothetical protein